MASRPLRRKWGVSVSKVLDCQFWIDQIVLNPLILSLAFLPDFAPSDQFRPVSSCPQTWDQLYCWPATPSGHRISELCSVVFQSLQELPRHLRRVIKADNSTGECSNSQTTFKFSTLLFPILIFIFIPIWILFVERSPFILLSSLNFFSAFRAIIVFYLSSFVSIHSVVRVLFQPFLHFATLPKVFFCLFLFRDYSNFITLFTIANDFK